MVRVPETGHVLLFVNGNSSAPVFRIDGWENWQRAEASFLLPQPATGATGDGTGLCADYFAALDWSGKPTVTQVDEQVYFDWIKNPLPVLPKRLFSAVGKVPLKRR